MSDLAKFEPQNMDELMKLSTWLAKSELIPDALKGKPANITLVLMAGREYGFSSMQALSLFDVIKGKPVLSAKGVVALCLRHRNICEYFKLVESTSEKCTYVTRREGSDPVPLTYSIRDAQVAGLTGKDVWKSHPAAMLRARCSKALADSVYPDLTKGLVIPDEAEEISSKMPEKDITPVPIKKVEPSPLPKPSKLKQALKSKIIDVEPGEDEEEAEQRLLSLESPPHSDSGAPPPF